MAHYIFVVNVRTDDTNPDTPGANTIRDEVLSNLDWSFSGIQRVTVREIREGSTLDRAMQDGGLNELS